ncbi:hypothetical protein Tco_0763055, partial [Tanacetum coccineum]
ESNIVCDKKSDESKENSDDSLVKEQVPKDTSSFVESSLNVDKETVFLDKKIKFVKPKNHEKPVKKSVRYAEMYRSQSPRRNKRNWNGQKSNQLGSDFVMVDYDYYAKTAHPSVHMNMSPRAVLLKSSLTPLNTVRPVNTAHPKPAIHNAKSMSHFSKQAQSTAYRPFYKQTSLTSRYVNTAKRCNLTERPKAVYAQPHDWEHRLNSQISRNMMEVYVLQLGERAHGGRISSKGTLKTNSLDFEEYTCQ